MLAAYVADRFSDDVVLCTHGPAELHEFVAGALEAPSVRIVESPVTAVEGQAGVSAAGDAAHLEAVPEPTTLVSVAAAAGVAAAVWMEQDLFRAGLPVAPPS